LWKCDLGLFSSLFTEAVTGIRVWYFPIPPHMSNFCSTLYFIYRNCISQHCKLHLCLLRSMQNQLCYQCNTAATGWLSHSLMAGCGKLWMNRFLAGWAKDKLDSLYMV
jgi:hypothetical protein